VVEDAKANAEYLSNLLPEYRKNPKLVRQKIYQDAIEKVLANVDEKIFIQPTPEDVERELRILLNRDPNIKKTKQSSNK
jgi:regulator of protease activity HflC (stomatin/prohibitin superfamily)